MYLGWNDFGMGSSPLFEGLAFNEILRVLDFSWNSIGGDPKALHWLCETFKQNTSLLHLDLSFCDFER